MGLELVYTQSTRQGRRQCPHILVPFVLAVPLIWAAWLLIGKAKCSGCGSSQEPCKVVCKQSSPPPTTQLPLLQQASPGGAGRTLGNGTFDQTMSRNNPMHNAGIPSSHPDFAPPTFFGMSRANIERKFDWLDWLDCPPQ